MESSEEVRCSVARRQLKLKALIGDVSSCRSNDQLEQFNAAGRAELARLRTDLDRFDRLARNAADDELIAEAGRFRDQFESCLKSFKNANISSLLIIQKALKEELLNSPPSENEALRRRKTDKSSLIQLSSNVTDQLLSISRRLAETTQRSAETLDNLVTSSASVHSTKEELQNTAGSITQSGKLLKKYGRREFTDKIVIVFAFMFFVVCVLYILHKRLL